MKELRLHVPDDTMAELHRLAERADMTLDEMLLKLFQVYIDSCNLIGATKRMDS